MVEQDLNEAEFLINGFSQGFSLHYLGPREGRKADNLKSAKKQPEIIKAKIDKEVEAGRVAGPFTTAPFSNLIISPIGLVPKKQPNEYRMIHHLSYPEGASINDFIDPSLTSVQYTSFDKAVEMIQELGQNCFLFKMDIKNAFKLIPIQPKDFHLLGFCFNDSYFFDKTLPFGASISCSTFERFARFLERCVKYHITSGLIIHYLDDFLGGDRTFDACTRLLEIFNGIMQQLNVPMALEKKEGPCEILVFLGLELNSKEMVVRIPLEKINEVITKIQNLLSKKKARVKEIQSLVGSLNFCCRAIATGRPFCRRLINTICGLDKPFHFVRINKSVKLDLQIWLWFFQHHNGISVFHDRFWVSNSDVECFTDSAGGEGLGFGIYFQGQWTAARWPVEWHVQEITKDITVLEIFPILVTLFIWGPKLRNKKICFNCDNESVVHILNTQTSKSDRVMAILRTLILQSLQNNILLRAKHVPGSSNSICDALSRFQMERFRQLAPEADQEPHKIPQQLWNIFSTEPTSFCDIPLHQTR